MACYDSQLAYTFFVFFLAMLTNILIIFFITEGKLVKTLIIWIIVFTIISIMLPYLYPIFFSMFCSVT